jgi:hypothetical protein
VTGLWTNDRDMLGLGIVACVDTSVVNPWYVTDHLLNNRVVRVLDPDDTELVDRVAAVLSMCTCTPGPGYEGPEEDCPRHGKPDLQARAVFEALRQP